MEKVESFADLVALMDRLRGPDGCPWDREQNYETLRGYLLEECYEVVDALDGGDPAALREELGDLLFQIVFLSRLAAEEGKFTASDVVREIGSKMIRRHPHVFRHDRLHTSDEVLRRWEQIKRAEKGDDREATAAPSSILDGVPRALPALIKAERLGKKAARVGFDWPDPDAILDKIREEIDEMREALAAEDQRRRGEELGDVLFSVVMLARHLGLDAERCLEGANEKFESRFRKLEAALRASGIPVEEAGPEKLEQMWREAKASEQARFGAASDADSR